MKITAAVRSRIVASSFAILCACSSGQQAASGPSGWTADGANRWSHDGASYAIETRAFSGTLKDLSSADLAALVLAAKGRKMQSTLPFPDCGGVAGLMTLSEAGSQPKTIERGFTISEGTATEVTYTRPAGQPEDPTVHDAMKATLCRL